MTEAEVIQHWRKRAKDSLTLARLAHEAGNHTDALFHCHLAVEKVLKAAIMERTHQPHPKIHNLQRLAMLVRNDWSDEEKDLFDVLTSFAVAARYDDPEWAGRYATVQEAKRCLGLVRSFLSRQQR